MSDELQHFGVKGMQWGVRKKDRSVPGPAAGSNAKKIGRAKNPDGVEEALRSAQTGKPVADKSDGPTIKDIRPRKGGVIDTVSNDELRKTIERMRLEREFAELSKIDLTRGQALRKKIANRAVDTLIDRVVPMVTNAALDAAKKQVTKRIGVGAKTGKK